MKEFIYRITRSSADPAAMSLSFRGALVGAVPVIVSIAPIFCSLHIACIDPNVVSPVLNTIADAVDNLLKAVAGFMILIGLVRKLWLGRFVHPAA